MPYTVNDIIDEQEVISVSKEDSVLKALTLMNEHDFSQLPVIDENRRALGMVTYESILKGIRNFKLKLEELKVRNVMTQSYSFYLEDTLSELLERLKSVNAVLIRRRDNTVAGILTTFDTTEYFRRYAEDLMVVEDIEGMMKDLIHLAYSIEADNNDSEQLSQAIMKHTKYKKGKPFNKLSFGDYVEIVLAEDTWPFMKTIFDMPSAEAVRNLLDEVRQTRNDLAHFQGEITHAQRAQLEFCADWLGRCQSEHEQRLEAERKNDVIVEPVKVTSTEDEIAEESHPSDSRYTPLATYLQAVSGELDVVRLSFEEIEKIIGGALPTSAYDHRAWWANDSKGHPHSQVWLDVGWRTNYLNRTEKVVTFVRTRERERAYIEFFSKLLAELRDKATFPVKQVSSDGTNWVVCQTITMPGLIVGQFNYSFARGKRFRVELYIDTSNQETTKQVFDNLYAQRSAIENVLGELSWERIDDKRASRIAIYHPGHITDDEEQLKVVREWAVEKMIAFYTTLEPIASKVFKEVLKP
jgi:CBS domain-containing protein